MQNLNASAAHVDYFDAHIGQNFSWRDYFGEYQAAVESLWNVICQGPILPDRQALPLLFLVRHTIELGYKTNISELNAVTEGSEMKAEHELEKLHQHLGEAFHLLAKKRWISDAIEKEFLRRYRQASKLTKWFHELDKRSDAFRYPFKTEQRGKGKRVIGLQHQFDFVKEVNLLTEVMEPYQEAMVFLNHTYDVLGLDELKHQMQCGPES